MSKLVECVPNFSEGRRREVVEEIMQAIASVPGVTLLDSEMDADHNRSVLTFAGEPEPVMEAAFRAVKRGSELIDLNQHKGEHPRMGAADVVPFVPVEGSRSRTARSWRAGPGSASAMNWGSRCSSTRRPPPVPTG